MEKIVNIFIAGAKDLAPQRLKLKAEISDLNHKLEDSKTGVRFLVSSFETFGNNQDEYNKFIQQKANLVIFVLKDRIGDNTQKEYLLAMKNKREMNHPKVVVFLNNYTEVTPDIAYINGLLSGEDYYISYENDADLVSKVKVYLEDFIKKEDCTTISESSDIKKKTIQKSPNFKNGWKIIIYFLAGVIFAVATMFRLEEPVLLIAGGGSAKNYIDLYGKIKIDKYPDSYYVHMPSGNAWLLLTEEVISPQTTPQYYPVCISASKATDKDFLKISTMDRFLESGSVIEAQLGEDTLAVCLQNVPSITEKLSKQCLEDKEISIQQLVQLMEDTTMINVFTTSPNSGTRTTYERLLSNANFSLETLKTRQFSEDTDMASINEDKPYLLLGSRCYRMKALEQKVHEGKAMELNVYDMVDGKRVYSTKPVYLYFMAYTRDRHRPLDKNEMIIPEPTLDLLKDLDIDISNKIKDGKVKRENVQRVVLSLNDLCNW
jgi:hypothetical protein